ncbi:MAG: hemerythrin domain-containing protein [Betaproteobacteria bacterium]|nr:hemerythrin domain-containing protein [Betaproteobacteria bacterium]
MSAAVATIDLRGEAPSQVQGAAYAALRELGRGEAVILRTAAEPTLLMQSLDLHLRHRLAWTISRDTDGFCVEVRHRDDTVARDVIELLCSAHHALDALFVRAFHRVNAGDTAGAKPLIIEFAAALRRHIRAEDEILAPVLGASKGPIGASPVAVMQREHAEILQQLAIVEESLAADPPSAAEAGAFCALLSGALAKHEQREEANVFPLWRALLGRRTEAERCELLTRVRATLQS